MSATQVRVDAHPHPSPLPQERERDTDFSWIQTHSRVREPNKRGRRLAAADRLFRAPSPGGEGWGEGGSSLVPSAIAKWCATAFLSLVACLPWSSRAAAPAITRVQPAAVVPGATTAISLLGENLNGTIDLWTSFPAEVSRHSNHDQAQFNLKVPPQTPVGIGAVRLITTNGMSGLTLLLVDALSASPSSGTNHSLATAQLIAVPGAVDGSCVALRSDFFRIAAKKGERINMEVVAQRIGSPLDPWIRLLDDQGRELASNDDAPGLGADARIDVRCPKTGHYFVEVRDTRHGGGAQHRYRLRVGPPLPAPLPFLTNRDIAPFTGPLATPNTTTEREPNNEPSSAQLLQTPVEVSGSFNVPGDRDVYEFSAKKDERFIFQGRTRSIGSPCDLFLRLESTNGTKIAEANATGADDGALTNRFIDSGNYRLVVEELNQSGGPTFHYQLAIQPVAPGFTLSTETERVSAPAGDSFTIEVRAERRDYDGPISLNLIEPSGSLSITNAVIPAKTNVAKITLSAVENLDLGDYLPFSLTGGAVIKGTDVTERVSTVPALRILFPSLRHPPRELDGLLMFSASESKSSSPKPAAKKKRK